MRYCSKCGTQLEDDMRYCVICGEPVPGQNRSSNAKKKKRGPKKKDIAVKNEVHPINKPLRTLISIIIGTAVLIALFLFIEFKPSDMAHYAAQVSDILTEYLEISSDTASRIGSSIIYTAVVMTIFSIYMISLRTSKVIRKAVNNGERFFILIAECIIVSVPMYFYYSFKESMGKSGGVDLAKELSDYIQAIVKSHGVERLGILLLYLLVLIAALFSLIFTGVIIYLAVYIIFDLFRSNIKINGVFFGVLSSVYDMFAAIFVCTAIICMISFAIGIIMLPIIFLAGCSDGRRVVEIDGKYYYVV